MSNLIFPSKVKEDLETLIIRDGIVVDIVDDVVRVHTHGAILQIDDFTLMQDYFNNNFSLKLRRIIPSYYTNMPLDSGGRYNTAGIIWEFGF